jgi:hypothetical protein
MLEQVFREATRSGEIADSLNMHIASLQAASRFEVGQAPINQWTEPAKGMLRAHARSSPKPPCEKLHATHSTDPDLSSGPRLNNTNSACSTPITAIETHTDSASATELIIIREKGKGKRKGSPGAMTKRRAKCPAITQGDSAAS